MKIKQFTIGPVMTNCFVLSDEGEAVLIDAAEYDEELVSYVRNNHLKLKMILLTHAHFDHTFGAPQYAEEFGAPAAIGSNDEASMHNPEINGSVHFGMRSVKTVDSPIKLHEGDQVKFGTTVLRVIDTPGHTGGGISFYTEGHLFCGDTLFEESIGRTDLETGNYEQLIRSISEKLYKLPDDTVVYPGHGGTTTIGYEKTHNYYVKG